MPPMNTTQFSSLLAPGLRKIYFNEYSDLAPEFPTWCNVRSSTRSFEDEQILAGFGTVPEKPEGQAVSYSDALEGGAKRYTHVSFGLGFKITWEMWSDDLYKKMVRMSKELARAFRNMAEVEAATILNQATSTTNEEDIGAADESLLSATHSLLGGGTISNRPASDTDISYAAVQNAIVNYHDLTDDQGITVNLRPSLALVTSADQFKAQEIFGQDTKPNSGDRDKNTVSGAPGMQSTYKVNHYLTDADRWFLLASKSQHSLQFFWRERPGFDTGDDFDSKNIKVTGFARLSHSHTDWRGVYGAPGA